MRSVTLARSGITTSKLGFGCAPLMGRVGKAKGLRALAAAHEAGVRHIDVARSYGYGEAEAALAGFLKGRRDSVVLASKVGIAPPPPSLKRRVVLGVARPVLAAVPALRARLAGRGGSLLERVELDGETIRRSVEASLTALRTDRLDLLLLHEATAESAGRDDVPETLERLVEAGKIRAWGVSTGIEETRRWHERLGDRLALAQIAANPFDPGADGLGGGAFDLIGHSPFGGRVGWETVDAIAGDVALRRSFLDRLGADPADRTAMARLLMRYALSLPRTGPIVCSMYDERHLAANLEALEAPPLDLPGRRALERAFAPGGLSEAAA